MAHVTRSKESKYPTIHCDCGTVCHAAYHRVVVDELVTFELCFKCNFWRKLIDSKDEPNHFVIDGHHYIALPRQDSRSSRLLGYSGREFVIRRLDSDELIDTNNLWHQGEIPERFRNQLPDTAEFISAPAPV